MNAVLMLVLMTACGLLAITFAALPVCQKASNLSIILLLILIVKISKLERKNACSFIVWMLAVRLEVAACCLAGKVTVGLASHWPYGRLCD